MKGRLSLKHILIATVCLAGRAALAGDRGLTNTWASPHVQLRCTDIDDVHWTEGFWADRFDLCHEAMIPNMWNLLADPQISHAYDNFLIAAGLKEGRHRGPKWHDGDFYKWLEAVAFVYGLTHDEALDRQMDDIIGVIGRAQREDGYLHTPVIIEARNRGSNAQEFQERLDFETYNMGHLMTCACVHYRATGKRSLLQIARRATDYLYGVYQRSPQTVANNAICPSHYMGVIEMYRTMRDPRYLELAKGLIDIRDQVTDGTDHNQDRIPFRQQTEAVGHAVRANYLYAGAADIYAETEDRSLLDTLETLWRDVAYRKMYITGATGALYDGVSPDGSKNHSAIQLVHQAYGRDYQLPNVTAYNESCATIGFALWNWRMLSITGEARYADLLEEILYNGVLSTISLDGKRFFYRNTLCQLDDLPFELRWSHRREPYISCFCCPPNIVRTIAEVAGYAYSVSDEGVWVNLYGGNTLATRLPNGSEVKLTQKTDYPWDGNIRIAVEQAPSEEFSLFLRIPAWARGAAVSVNGQAIERPPNAGQYCEIRRRWPEGDRVELVLPMRAQLIEAHPMVEETRNQVAVRRGPIVYCLESLDLPTGVDIQQVAVTPDIRLSNRFDRELLGGIVVLEGQARRLAGDEWGAALYRELPSEPPKPVDICLIPYYAWGNRGDSEMTVWLPIR
ncbi:MAG: glycoside hydrolase family 127 protein [Sedimentisphaerales bacterium]|nr:glycoside hydrolase family 127 protein [Sedimentisphaerales bacterium]